MSNFVTRRCFVLFKQHTRTPIMQAQNLIHCEDTSQFYGSRCRKPNKKKKNSIEIQNFRPFAC